MLQVRYKYVTRNNQNSITITYACPCEQRIHLKKGKQKFTPPCRVDTKKATLEQKLQQVYIYERNAEIYIYVPRQSIVSNDQGGEEILTAIIKQHILTYGDNLSPILAAFQTLFPYVSRVY